MAGFVEFFYNIIPGGLFQIALILTFVPFNKFLAIFKSDSNTFLILSIFIITSLFFGFCFQMINSWINWLNTNSTLRDINKNNEKNYKRALTIVKGLGVSINKDTADKEFKWLLQLHYYMDDYIRYKNSSDLHKFFHFRISLWANTFIISVIYAFILLVASLAPSISPNKSNFYISLSMISILITIFCYFAAKKSQEIFCDFVLKTFLMATGQFKKIN